MSEVQAEAALLHRQRLLPLLFVKSIRIDLFKSVEKKKSVAGQFAVKCKEVM